MNLEPLPISLPLSRLGESLGVEGVEYEEVINGKYLQDQDFPLSLLGPMRRLAARAKHDAEAFDAAAQVAEALSPPKYEVVSGDVTGLATALKNAFASELVKQWNREPVLAKIFPR